MKREKVLWVLGALAIVLAVVLINPVNFSSNAQATAKNSATPILRGVTQMSTGKEDSEIHDEYESELTIQINDTRMRRSGEKWKYSTNGGKAWSDPPGWSAYERKRRNDSMARWGIGVIELSPA